MGLQVGDLIPIGGGGYSLLSNIEGFTADGIGDGFVELSWKDPDDVFINGTLITSWEGTQIRRKTGNFPVNEKDGELVLDSKIRNQYETTSYVDSGLVNDTEYFYMAFPYTDKNVFTVDSANRVSATPALQRIYGVRVDKENSNPETRVTYIGDSTGFTPLRGNDGVLQWGSWENTDLLNNIKPCVLQNLGGGNAQVNYYLNPANFAEKEDGVTASVIDGTDGDVMIEIPERYWKFTDEGTTYTVEVSDLPFDGAIKLAHEIQDGYNQVSWYPLTLLQSMMVILLKSTDTQTALGRGRVDEATGYASTGGTNSKGMFYGSTADEQMKFLGVEDFWGNKRWWIDGLFYNASRNMLIGTGNFNDTGSGYTDYGATGFASDNGGYIDEVQSGNSTGFIPKSVSGSETTYYADYGYVGGSRMPNFGGHRTSAGSAGGFYPHSYTATYSTANVGSRLCYKKADKLYIGAYLGTVTGGKLRSISGTAEPTGDKTIGAFRTDAKANND